MCCLQVNDDLFIYNSATNVWEWPVMEGVRPAARNAAVACLIQVGRELGLESRERDCSGLPGPGREGNRARRVKRDYSD